MKAREYAIQRKIDGRAVMEGTHACSVRWGLDPARLVRYPTREAAAASMEVLCDAEDQAVVVFAEDFQPGSPAFQTLWPRTLADSIKVWECAHCRAAIELLDDVGKPAECSWCQATPPRFVDVTAAALARLESAQRAERERSRLTNQAIAEGRVVVDYDPLRLLSQLRAQVSYLDSHGYAIVLGKGQDAYWLKRIRDVLEFHGVT